jgi:hypothetical protein
VLGERCIKAAVIDHLLSTGVLNDAVLINEMVYANWSRRADLAVANGHLHAFEIKSDFDSLRRLEGQIAIYLQRFDKLTVVVAPKYLTSVLEMTPPQVAIWCALEDGAGVKIKVVRVGRRARVENRDVLIDYLLREELYGFLTAQGFKVRRSDSRSSLVNLARTQPLSKLRAYVLYALKERYRDSFNAFKSLRKETTSPDDLIALRKIKTIQAELLQTAMPMEHTNSKPQRVQLALSRLFPTGEIPAEIPTSISIRSKVPKRRKISRAD